MTASLLAGCHSVEVRDPAAVFQDIRSDFLHGNLDAARHHAEEARQDFSLDPNNWGMKFRLLEAEILTYQGRRSEVVALLDSPDVSYPAAGELAIKRDYLRGMADARLGQPQKADTELQEAQRLSAASNPESMGEVLRAKAVVEISRGHVPEAEDLFKKSLAIAREQHDSFLEAANLLNLGLSAVEEDHYDEALAFLKSASDVARPIKARFVIEAALTNEGLSYLQLGDFEKALFNFQQGEQAARETGATSYQVSLLADEAECYYLLGDLQKSKTSYQDALRAAQIIKAPAEIIDIETGLAFVLYRFEQFDSAKAHSDEAIRVAHAAEDKSGELRPQFLQALLAERVGQGAEKMLLQVHEKSAELPSLRAEIENALANYYVGRKQPGAASLWYRKSIRTFEDQREAVKDEELKLPYFANGDTFYRDYADFLIASQKQEQALQLLDIGRAKTLAEGLASSEPTAYSEKTVDLQAVANKLGGVILFYSLGAAKSYLWAVTPNVTRVFPLPGRQEIKAQLDSYQKSILRSNDPLRDANEHATGLFDTLVAPAAALIPKGSRVFVISDSVLNGLNFETLLVSGADGLHYWIEDVTVSNASSIHLLSRVDPASHAAHPRKLLLIGNPIAAGTGYDTLTNAFAEIRGIEKHFPPVGQTVITQSGAIPAAYAAINPDQFQFIHFVAHGTASQLDPLDSAVVLSPPPGNPEGFKLYARDIMRSPLHAELVTISACYGSGLRSYAGEGLVGLSWAFLRAGAHNVIGALWEVNDASTPLLMDRLYTELEAGHRPDEALRTAKLSLIHSPAVYRKPLYWGGLQLYTGS